MNTYKTGKVYEIIDNKSEHGFEIGQYVKLGKQINGGWVAYSLSNKEFWYVEERELRSIND